MPKLRKHRHVPGTCTRSAGDGGPAAMAAHACFRCGSAASCVESPTCDACRPRSTDGAAAIPRGNVRRQCRRRWRSGPPTQTCSWPVPAHSIPSGRPCSPALGRAASHARQWHESRRTAQQCRGLGSQSFPAHSRRTCAAQRTRWWRPHGPGWHAGLLAGA